MAEDQNNLFFTRKQAKAFLASGLVAAVLSTGVGVGIGAGTHKLTTAIINHFKPEQQIEQTVEVEPRLTFDEIQVEK